MGDKVVIIVESKKYEVSKLALAATGSYFNSMFNGEFLEKNKSTVTIKGITAAAWEDILHFFEHGRIKPKSYTPNAYKELLNLLLASDMFQLSDIPDICVRLLYDALEPANALEVLEVACRLDIDSLIQKSRSIVLWYSDVITLTDTFLKQEFEQVEGYLSDKGIHNANGEFGIWEAVERWINAGPDYGTCRTEFLPQLLKCVQLKGLSLSDLKMLSVRALIRSHAVIFAAVKDVIEERIRTIQEERKERRNRGPRRIVRIARAARMARVARLTRLARSGRLGRAERAARRCERAELAERRCERAERAVRRNERRCELAEEDELDLQSDDSENAEEVSPIEVDAYVESWRTRPARRLPLVPAVVAKISQDNSLPSPYILRYSFMESRFIPVLRLDEVETNLNALVGFKVISEGSKLYMLGGEIMTRQVSWYLAIWEYDQIFEQWKFIANLRKEIRHASVCIVGDDLYVIGGFGRHRLIQDTVSKLSLTNKIWTTCAPLPRPMYSVPCCVFRGKIYAIQTEIYQYCPDVDMWLLLDVTLPPGEVFCTALVSEDYIYVAGLRRCVYRFDPMRPNTKLVEVGRFEWECSQACLVDDFIYSISQIDFDYELYCERLDVRTGRSVTLWKGVAGNEIETFSPNHHHGCFPLLMY